MGEQAYGGAYHSRHGLFHSERTGVLDFLLNFIYLLAHLNRAITMNQLTIFIP